MNASGRRSKRRAGAGCGSAAQTKTATGNFRLPFPGSLVSKRLLRSTSVRIGTLLNLSKDVRLVAVCYMSVMLSCAFVLGLGTYVRALSDAIFETRFVVGEAHDSRHQMLSVVSVERFHKGPAS
jgi:hypothetical protein